MQTGTLSPRGNQQNDVRAEPQERRQLTRQCGNCPQEDERRQEGLDVVVATFGKHRLYDSRAIPGKA